MKTMKLMFNILICLSAFCSSAQYLTNGSVMNHMNVCGVYEPIEGVFLHNNGTTCIGGQTKLYYSFSPNESVPLSTGLGLDYEVLDAVTGLPTINTTYILYGPFNMGDDYVAMINGNYAPVALTGGGVGEVTFILSGNVVANKFYIIEITANACTGKAIFHNQTADFPCSGKTIECESCIPKFQPVTGKYVVSAWVKEEDGSGDGSITYTNSSLKVTTGSGTTLNTYVFTPSGQIIDGWQRMEGIVETDAVGNIKMEFLVAHGVSYFDDIRVFPYDGSMVTYVYDPATLRLAAELDERNYAKIYEYDEEGKLIRVKKETEKGVMTIQENRENSSRNY